MALTQIAPTHSTLEGSNSTSGDDAKTVVMNSPVGFIGITTRRGYVVGLTLKGKAPKQRFDAPETMLETTVEARLNAYFSGEKVDFSDLPLAFEGGTPFQQRTWEQLQTIPYGEVRSYGWLAEKAGSPRGARAVGQANGRNPLPIVIPCHRVIAHNGSLGGYMSSESGENLEIKRFLLTLEGAL